MPDREDLVTVFDSTARELTAQGMSGDAVAVELVKRLPKRALAEWMIGYNVKSRYR